MKIERERPRAHIVMDNFFDEAALRVVFAEVASLERKLKPGLVRELGHDGQSVFFQNERRKNRAVWIHEGSKTLSLFREALWSPSRMQVFEHACEPLFQIIPNCAAPHLQVSSYRNGDHYDFHEDEGAGVNLTAIVFLARDPKKIRGGDLVLSYKGEEKTVRFRNNRLVIFPSKTLHRVTPVHSASKDPLDARISLQCWLTYGGTAVASKVKRKLGKGGKAGLAKVDEPTFLLAEESIVAGAQALLPATKAPVHAPEALYWGAFYLTRILTANLRFLAQEQRPPVSLGAIRVRNRGELEVYGSLQMGTEKVRVGFLLRSADTSPSEALSLFVTSGRGRSRHREERVLYPGTEAPEAAALLGRLLTRASLQLKSRAGVLNPLP